jgi:hypothetical protein|tara:strand:+ start:10938 stop:11258 length:321 start_codon:yes stop_codon:yes gene_type:complete
MRTLKIEYKYIVGQVVYFMYENEIRKGIVSSISINASTRRLETYLTKKIVNKLISFFYKDYPFEKINVSYSLDLVSKTGDFQSSPHLLYEYDVFETEEEIIDSIKL